MKIEGKLEILDYCKSFKKTFKIEDSKGNYYYFTPKWGVRDATGKFISNAEIKCILGRDYWIDFPKETIQKARKDCFNMFCKGALLAHLLVDILIIFWLM